MPTQKRAEIWTSIKQHFVINLVLIYLQVRNNATGPGPLLGHGNYLQTQVFIRGGLYFKPFSRRQAFHLSAPAVHLLQRCKDTKGIWDDNPLNIRPVSTTRAVLDKRILPLGTMGGFYVKGHLLCTIAHVQYIKSSPSTSISSKVFFCSAAFTCASKDWRSIILWQIPTAWNLAIVFTAHLD